MRSPALHLVIALLLVSASGAGLATAVDGISAPTAEHAQSTTDQTTTTNESSDGPPVSGLAFFTTSSPDSVPPLRIGFGLKPGADGFFVLESSDGSVLGVTEFHSPDAAIQADGYPLPFDEPVSGIQTVSVVAYADANGNNEYDPGVDEPYRDSDGAVVRDTTTVLLPTDDGVLENVTVSMVPPTAGAQGVHHYRLKTSEDVQVSAIGLDVRGTGIRAQDVVDGRATLKVDDGSERRRIDPDTATTALHGRLAVLSFEEPVSIPAGSGTVLTISDVPNPYRPGNATLVLDPNGTADAAIAHFEPDRAVPKLRSVTVDESGETVTVNAYFPTGKEAVVAVTHDGEVVGRSQPIGGQPNMHVDALDVALDEPVATGESITVGLLQDANSDGTYGRAYRWDSGPVAQTVTVGEAQTTTPAASTTEPPGHSTTTQPTAPSETTTTTPGFGPLLAGVALVAGALLGYRRW